MQCILTKVTVISSAVNENDDDVLRDGREVRARKVKALTVKRR